MLRVLIVDDDFTARSNIKTMIDWENNGFLICGEATNGQIALQMIKEETPDIVITDMKMPLLDGVGLIEYIHGHYRDMKCIALSSYDEFDYVKQSLKSGAVDYLLKHKLSSSGLLNVLQAAGEKISRETTAMKQLVASREILRRNFIKRLILGDFRNSTAIKMQNVELEMQLDSGQLALVVVSIDDFQLLKERFTQAETSNFLASLANLTEEILRDMGNASMAFVEESKFVVMFNFGNIRSNLYIYNHMVTTVKRIRTSLKRYLNITACFSMGQLFNHVEDTPKYYTQANGILYRKMIAGKDNVFSETVQLEQNADFLNLDLQEEKQMMLAIKAGDMNKITQYLDDIFTKVTELRVNYKSVQMICGELIGIANRVSREASIDIKEIYSNKEIPYEEMKKHETILDVKEWIKSVYERLVKLLLHVEFSESYNGYTRKAIEYIRQNYSKDISLNLAAESAGLNSSYLSRVFKEDCGIGFNEYLNNVRVTQARYLIERTDIKLKEIVRQVGFNNYTYFFKVFKIVVGVTPVEYKEKCKASNAV